MQCREGNNRKMIDIDAAVKGCPHKPCDFWTDCYLCWEKELKKQCEESYLKGIDEFAKILHKSIGLDRSLNHHDVDFLADMAKEKNTCGTCLRYADLHSSCEKVRKLKVNADTVACENYKGAEE